VVIRQALVRYASNLYDVHDTHGYIQLDGEGGLAINHAEHNEVLAFLNVICIASCRTHTVTDCLPPLCQLMRINRLKNVQSLHPTGTLTGCREQVLVQRFLLVGDLPCFGLHVVMEVRHTPTLRCFKLFVILKDASHH
jgi:hypothetical protein